MSSSRLRIPPCPLPEAIALLHPRWFSTPSSRMTYLKAVLSFSFLLYLSLTAGISLSARRALTTFSLLTNSTTCASSITHTKIRSYRRINPADLDGVYDGFLWDSLVIDSTVCQPNLQTATRQSTFLRPRATSPPGVPADEAQPFFLEGRDNSPRNCVGFNTTFPGSYLFTDDLPTFRDRFQGEGLIDPGVETDSIRGVVYMFVVPISDDGDIVGRACAYIEVDEVALQSPEMEIPDMPACFPGNALVDSPFGRVPMHKLDIGDFVLTQQGPQKVISFTHRAPKQTSTFIRLTSSNASIDISRDHLLLANGVMVPAGSVSKGDVLAGSAGRVQSISEVLGDGLYAPVTESGSLIVQGVVVSCYTAAFREVIAHALLSPVRGASRVVMVDVCALVDGLRSFWWR